MVEADMDALAKRRIVVGPVLALLLGLALWPVADDVLWSEAFLPALLVAVLLATRGVALLLPREETRAGALRCRDLPKERPSHRDGYGRRAFRSEGAGLGDSRRPRDPLVVPLPSRRWASSAL